MKIVLATGIYPPDIGGPATYVRGLAEALDAAVVDICVITYGREDTRYKMQDTKKIQEPIFKTQRRRVYFVEKHGGPFLRWWRYARALRKHAADADAVIAFSSISAGMPLILARLKKPKMILRLGGDFFWERYTDRGGMMDLEEWHGSWRSWIWRLIMQRILKCFDHVVYSSDFQRGIHKHYYALRSSSIIENPRPSPSPRIPLKVPHKSFHLLYMGRFVGFKNLLALIDAMHLLPDVHLTLVGSGPMEPLLRKRAEPLADRVEFVPPVTGLEKNARMDESDLLILPSLTEITPNVAAEAVSRGLPVLLTQSTGLCGGALIVQAKLRTLQEIAAAVGSIMARYPQTRPHSSNRDWSTVAGEWQALFSR
jgi:glycosyltransferase involved in cell wall biosynthesis